MARPISITYPAMSRIDLMLRSLPAAAAVIIPSLPAPGQAAKVTVWHHHAASHYDKAQLRGAVASSEGAVRLARQLRPLAGLDATHVWDVVEDSDGDLLVATGDEGKVFKVTADGK